MLRIVSSPGDYKDRLISSLKLLMHEVAEGYTAVLCVCVRVCVCVSSTLY